MKKKEMKINDRSKILLWFEYPELTVSVDVNLIKHHVGKLLSRHLGGDSIDSTDGLKHHGEDIILHQ